MNHLQEAKKIFAFATDEGIASELSYGEYALLGGMIAIAEQLEKMNEGSADLRKGIAMIGEGAGFIKKKPEDK